MPAGTYRAASWNDGSLWEWPYGQLLKLKVEPVLQLLMGVNAAVVGILAAPLFDPSQTFTVHTLADLALALLASVALALGWDPAWLVVVLATVAGWAAAVLLRD